MKSKVFVWKKIVWWFVAAVICLIHLVPFYILIGVAFKSPTDTSSRWVLPGYIYFNNFRDAIRDGGILRSLLNTVIISGSSVILIMIIGALAAYPLARNKSKLNKAITAFVLCVMIVPPLSILVPLYSMIADLRATSTYWGIILVLVTFQLPTCIYLFTNFIASIPKTLDEAASIDGCSSLMLFFRIILPQLKPVIASAVIIIGIVCWNDYTFSLYLLQRPHIKTVTLSVASFFSQYYNNMGGAAATALLGMLPLVLLFLFLQKYFIQGVIDSAIK